MANIQHSSLTGAELHVPKTHKDSHVDGTDDIRDATAALKGIATAAQITKLDGIATGADVTGSNPPQAHDASVHTDRIREMFLSYPYKSTGTEHNYSIILGATGSHSVHYPFWMPKDFVSISYVYVYYYVSTTSGNVVLNTSALYGAVGEAFNNHNESDNANVVAIANTNLAKFTTVGLLASAAIGDIGTILIQRDGDHASDTNAGDMYLKGVVIGYTADM